VGEGEKGCQGCTGPIGEEMRPWHRFFPSPHPKGCVIPGGGDGGKPMPGAHLFSYWSGAPLAAVFPLALKDASYQSVGGRGKTAARGAPDQ